jgi:hypothetical protein
MYYEKYRTYKGLFKFWEIIHFRYRKGMRKQFARLHWECVEQQRAKESLGRKDHEERMQKEKATTQYCAQLDALPHDKFMLSAVPYHHQAARKSTHAQIRTTAADRFTKNHTITHGTIAFGQTYDISEHNLVTMHGNAYEQQLHSEFLEQLTETHTICTAYSLCPNNILIDAVEHGIAIGMEANRLKKPAIATAWANFGWKALDLLHAAGEGLLLSVKNTANMLLHPKHTLKQVVHGLGSFVGLLAHTCAYTVGTAAYWHELMEHGDGLLMAQEMDSVAHKAKTFGAYCLKQAASLEARDVVKHGATIAADILLTHKMFTLGGRLFAELKPVFMDIIKATSAEHASVELALQGAEELGITKRIHLSQEVEKNGLRNIFTHASRQITLEEAAAKWEASEGLKKLELYCERLANKVADTRLGSRENGLDLLRTEYEKLAQLAAQKYEKIRSTADDIAAIAKYTGIDIEIVTQIKEHVFLKEHILHAGIERFAPDLDMADAWERLISNTFLKSDLEFLKHEYAESILMGACEVPWRNAHDLTNTAYNWMKYLEG